MDKQTVLAGIFFLLVFSAGFLMQPGIVRNADSPEIAGALPAQNAGKMSARPIEFSPEHPLPLARFSLGTGDYEQAGRAAQQCIREYPESLLLDYAYLYLAYSYFHQGRYPEAREVLDHLKTAYPQSRLLADAAFLEADTYFYEHEYDRALQAYTGLRQRKAYQDHRLLPSAHLKLAYCYEQKEDFSTALGIYHQTWKDAIYTPAYALARDHEARLLARFPKLLTQFSTKEVIASIDTLLKRGKAADALPWLRRLQARRGKSDAGVMLKWARTYYLLRENSKSRAYYREFLRDAPRHQLVPYALDRIGRLYLRQGRLEDFLRIYRRLREEHPSNTYTASAVRLYGKELELFGRFQEAVAQFNTFLRAYPKHSLTSDVLWNLGWSQYQSQQQQAALKTFARLLRSYPKSYHKEKALYWAGRAAEHVHEYARAADSYMTMLKTGQQHSYMGELCRQALERVAQLAPEIAIAFPAKATTPLPFDEPIRFSTKQGRFHWRKSQELEQIELFDLAAEEFACALDREKKDRAKYLELARLYHQAGQYHELLRLMQGHFWLWIVRGGENVPQRFWEYAYPLSFFDIISQYTTDSDLDPFLVQALMMAESVFDPNAMSPAGALGLMQLMPATGERLAAGLGMSIASPAQYLRPEINIRLGTTYLKQLLELFDQQLPPVIASYNAGEHRVKDWWREAYRDDPAAFVAMIPYRETQNYVQKVLWYYQEYQRIYPAHRTTR